MMRNATVFAALFTGAQAIITVEESEKMTKTLHPEDEKETTSAKQVENDGDDFDITEEEFKKIQDMLSGEITPEMAEKMQEMFMGMVPKTEEEAQALQKDLMSMLLSKLPQDIKSNMEDLQKCLERAQTRSLKDDWEKDVTLIIETASVLKKSMIAMGLPEEQAENIANKGAPIALFLSAAGINDHKSAGNAEAMNNLATKIFAHMSSGHQNTETMIESVKESLSDAKEMLEVVMGEYKEGTSQGMAFLATEAENAMKSILDQTSEDMAENLQLVFGNATQIPMGKLKVEEIADTINNMFTGAIDAEDQQEDVEVN